MDVGESRRLTGSVGKTGGVQHTVQDVEGRPAPSAQDADVHDLARPGHTRASAIIVRHGADRAGDVRTVEARWLDAGRVPHVQGIPIASIAVAGDVDVLDHVVTCDLAGREVQRRRGSRVEHSHPNRVATGRQVPSGGQLDLLVVPLKVVERVIRRRLGQRERRHDEVGLSELDASLTAQARGQRHRVTSGFGL